MSRLDPRLGRPLEPKETRSSKGPEAPIKEAIKKYMEERKWFVKITHGNAFQSGLPDLYCIHQSYRDRWIEVKYAGKYEFTPAQLITFRQFAECGMGIWVIALYDPKDMDMLAIEYKKLWQAPNWHSYIGHTRKPF